MEKLVLSADDNVLLYEVKKEIIDDFENIIESFYEWKDTNTYNEQLFVDYIKQTYGDNSIIFIEDLGYFNEFNIPNQYKNIKWFNF